MLKSVIVGCGKIAGAQSQALTTHGGAYQDNKYINLVACVDHDRQKREAFASLFCLNLLQALETFYFGRFLIELENNMPT